MWSENAMGMQEDLLLDSFIVIMSCSISCLGAVPHVHVL